MLVIREKSNHLSILAYGYVERGGLGEYDKEIFEEVELEKLPEGFLIHKKTPLAMGLDILALAQNAFEKENGLVRSALLHYFDSYPLPVGYLEKLALDVETKTKLTVLAKAQGNGTVHFSLLSWLQSTTCNPLSKADFDNLLAMLDLLPVELSNVKESYKLLAGEWAKSVKFKPEPTEDDKGTDKPEPPPSEVQQLVKGSCPTPQTLDKRGRKYGKRAASVKG